MASSYKFHNPNGIYFITFSVVEWIDVFTRQEYAEIVIASLAFCQAKKGLVIHAWCIMSNHLHLIISKNGENDLHEILRDMKKYTSSQIIKAIEASNESRKKWMLWLFRSAGERNPNNQQYQFWQQDNHPLELTTPKFILQKLQYIHRNPVKAGIVMESQHYKHSSAIDYAGGKGLLDIAFLG